MRSWANANWCHNVAIFGAAKPGKDARVRPLARHFSTFHATNLRLLSIFEVVIHHGLSNVSSPKGASSIVPKLSLGVSC